VVAFNSSTAPSRPTTTFATLNTMAPVFFCQPAGSPLGGAFCQVSRGSY
jgi:hypothetical protein